MISWRITDNVFRKNATIKAYEQTNVLLYSIDFGKCASIGKWIYGNYVKRFGMDMRRVTDGDTHCFK